MRYGDTRIIAAVIETVCTPKRFDGYDIFLKPGSPATPGTGLPIKRTPTEVWQVTLPEAELALQSNATSIRNWLHTGRPRVGGNSLRPKPVRSCQHAVPSCAARANYRS